MIPMRSNGDADRQVNDAVRSIGQHARAANLIRANHLATALAEAAAGSLVEGQRIAAVDHAHQLVGSAGTFGFPVASELAAALEGFFHAGVFGDTAATATARGQLRDLFTVLSAEPADPSDPATDL